jgi:hypothetical protein
VTDPGPDPAGDPALQDFATKIFNLARAGAAAPLAGYLDAGVPANLTNDRGDTLIMLAAYHGHAPAVRVLLDRGADPAAGHPSAIDTARMFGNDEFLGWFAGGNG